MGYDVDACFGMGDAFLWQVEAIKEDAAVQR